MLIVKNMPQRFAHMLLAALVLFMPIAVQAQTDSQTPVDEPKIVFDNIAHDFGTAEPNKRLTHNFVFKNQGTAELMIEKVKAG